jgi:8-oxo-dGTP pyrophosphatase MutT (NUDIX family)
MVSADQRAETPIPAASLILARPAAGLPEVCLLKRSSASRFMPGSYVFPGGWIDAGDRDAAFWGARCDLSPADVARRLARGIDAATALSAAVAAARETFEEAGVLFARPPAAAGADAPSDREVFRRRFEQGVRVLELSALAPWSHWITPVGMPRRFDTRFFAAALPAGQKVRPDGRETTDAVWVTPRQALDGNMAGRLPLSPPTLATLHELLDYPTIESLTEETGRRGWGNPILPRLVPLGKPHGAVIVAPWDPSYASAEIPVDAADLENRVLPVGAPFSRIWNLNGFCRPIRAG